MNSWVVNCLIDFSFAILRMEHLTVCLLGGLGQHKMCHGHKAK